MMYASLELCRNENSELFRPRFFETVPGTFWNCSEKSVTKRDTGLNALICRARYGWVSFFITASGKSLGKRVGREREREFGQEFRVILENLSIFKGLF